MERQFDDMLQESLAAVAALESSSVNDLIQMRSQFYFMPYRLADLGDCRGVGRSVYFAGHPRTPVEKRISRIAGPPVH